MTPLYHVILVMMAGVSISSVPAVFGWWVRGRLSLRGYPIGGYAAKIRETYPSGSSEIDGAVIRLSKYLGFTASPEIQRGLS